MLNVSQIHFRPVTINLDLCGLCQMTLHLWDYEPENDFRFTDCLYQLWFHFQIPSSVRQQKQKTLFIKCVNIYNYNYIVNSAALKQYMWTGWNSHNFSRSYILNVIIAENTTQLVPLTCLHADFVRYHNHINNDSACWAVCPTSYQMLAVRQFSCLPSEKRAEKKKKERFSYFNVFLCGQRSGNTGGK